MDDCWSLRPVEDDELQELTCAVRPEDEITGGVLADFLDDLCAAHSVFDVAIIDPVAPRRGEQLHTLISYYGTGSDGVAINSAERPGQPHGEPSSSARRLGVNRASGSLVLGAGEFSLAPRTSGQRAAPAM